MRQHNPSNYNYKKHLFHSLFGYYIKINDLKGTMGTFNAMDIKHKNKFIYSKMMGVYLNNDMNNQVIKLFFQMKCNKDNQT